MMKKFWKLACHLVISNNTIDSLPTLQISLGIIAIFEKIRDGKPILMMWKVWRCAVIGKQLLVSNDINRVHWAVLGLSQDGVCWDSFKKFSVKSSKRDKSNDTKCNPSFFSLVNAFRYWIFYNSVKLPCGGCIFTSGSLLSHLQLAWSARVALRDFLQVSISMVNLLSFSHMKLLEED